jgi:arsenite methyltransferase
MPERKSEEIRDAVRDHYAQIARDEVGGCGCSCGSAPTVDEVASTLGYSDEDLAAAPAGANLGVGCGNPQAIAALTVGETVLDLGSGAGFDCFLAARNVGETGHVIGIDMTPDMIRRARSIAEQDGFTNVEFRLGEIEHIPAADASVDVILSNCVINLSPDKPAVYRDAFRVLRPGGRFVVSDVVALSEIPESLRGDLGAISGCVAGAIEVDAIRTMLGDAGFTEVEIDISEESRKFIQEIVSDAGLEDCVASAVIRAAKP